MKEIEAAGSDVDAGTVLFAAALDSAAVMPKRNDSDGLCRSYSLLLAILIASSPGSCRDSRPPDSTRSFRLLAV